MIYRFGPYELDLARVELRSDGNPCPLEPQVFALLAYLVENRERLVSRDELIEKIWDGRVVSDSAISSRVKSARQALGDDGKAQRYIRTLHRQGFRFVAEVRQDARIAGQPVAVPGAPSDDSSPPIDARPSIAVLPFTMLTEAPRHAAIADALPHELITELARLRWLVVTARGSSFRLRSANPDVREIGRLLGVRYVLSGTVEITGARLVVTTELASTRDGQAIWGERYPGTVDDVHAVREEIRGRILTALELQIPLNEALLARLVVTGNLDAWSAYHVGLQHMYRFNGRDNAIAAELFGRAIAQDPGFARAHAGLSFTHFQTAFMRRTDDLAAEIALARACAQRAVEIDPLDPFVNFAMGRTYWLEGDLDGGLGWLERATALSPNYAQGLYARAWTETLAGREAQGRAHVDFAMRLSPLDPLYYAMLGTRAFTHLADGNVVEGAAWAGRAARSPGAHVLIAMIAAAAHQMAGDPAEAAHWAANVRARNARLSCADFFRSFPVRPPGVRERVEAALRDLGF